MLDPRLALAGGPGAGLLFSAGSESESVSAIGIDSHPAISRCLLHGSQRRGSRCSWRIPCRASIPIPMTTPIQSSRTRRAANGAGWR